MKKKIAGCKSKASRKVVGTSVSVNLRPRVIASGAKQSLPESEIASSSAPPRNGPYSSSFRVRFKDFSALIAEVRGLIQSARHAAATAVNTLQVLTNFEIGRRIVEHEQQGAARAAYGKELLKELSVRLTEEFGQGFSKANLEFLGLEKESSSESDLEQAIINRLEHFLLELGKGFLFEARQKRFTFDENHFFVDLVFYNRLLRCYVLIDLKLDKLTHQDLGQMQMYVNYFDRYVKTPGENPTIGILLCKQKKDAITLRNISFIYLQRNYCARSSLTGFVIRRLADAAHLQETFHLFRPTFFLSLFKCKPL